VNVATRYGKTHLVKVGQQLTLESDSAKLAPLDRSEYKRLTSPSLANENE